MIRRPAVAGSFYPGSKQSLEKELANYIEISEDRKKVLGMISPHAGYVYSGPCAGKGFGKIAIPGTIVILGVNHRGMGHPYAVDGSDHWHTPLGDIELDDELRSKLVENSHVFAVDTYTGQNEHSLEVQVPFIQYLQPTAKILPITVSSMDIKSLLLAGRELAALLEENNDVMLLASTDMSHYVSADTARLKDQKAIDKILALDPKGLFETVIENHISMCGIAPTVIMLNAAKEAGASQVETVDYTNSGVASGDYQQVVAYYSAIIF